MNIALTGSTGLIGSRVLELLGNDFNFIPLRSSQMDITNESQVRSVLDGISFDMLLHFTAYTNVDKAETDIDAVRLLNVDATRFLFEASQKKNARFVYISTDFVFDGERPPYDEDSVPNPLGMYAKTKYEGEKIVAGNAMIVRTAYPYRKEFEKKRDFVRSVKYMLEQGNELNMVTDSLMTPTFIDDIACALKYLIPNFSPEIFHIVGSSSISPYDAGRLIAEVFGLDGNLIAPTTYGAYFHGKAPRPQYSEIISKKNTFYPMKSFQEGLQLIAKESNM